MVNGPNDEQISIILGRKGSGKTWFAVNLLSLQDFKRRIWIIVDYKRDALINTVVKQNHIKEIYPTKRPPTNPGLYIMHPRLKDDDEIMEQWLRWVYEQEDIGLYIDEGYALPQRDAFDTILTQGRSKKIPVIALYQRPVWMSRFAIAEADYIAAFEQDDPRDLKTTNGMVKPLELPTGELVSVHTRLPKYHCLWRDIGNAKTDILKPVPGRNTILQNFRDRLNTKERYQGAIV